MTRNNITKELTNDVNDTKLRIEVNRVLKDPELG